MPQQSQQVQVLVIEMQHEGSLSTNTQQMDADKILEDPASRGVWDRLPLLVWARCLVVLECLADAILQGSLHQQADCHDHQQRYDPLGFLEIKGGGQKAWIFQEPQATFGMLLTFIPREELLGQRSFAAGFFDSQWGYANGGR